MGEGRKAKTTVENYRGCWESKEVGGPNELFHDLAEMSSRMNWLFEQQIMTGSRANKELARLRKVLVLLTRSCSELFSEIERVLEMLLHTIPREICAIAMINRGIWRTYRVRVS
jgi:hypothetical protein